MAVAEELRVKTPPFPLPALTGFARAVSAAKAEYLSGETDDIMTRPGVAVLGLMAITEVVYPYRGVVAQVVMPERFAQLLTTKLFSASQPAGLTPSQAAAQLNDDEPRKDQAVEDILAQESEHGVVEPGRREFIEDTIERAATDKSFFSPKLGAAFAGGMLLLPYNYTIPAIQKLIFE
jgi:hypothetical protein